MRKVVIAGVAVAAINAVVAAVLYVMHPRYGAGGDRYMLFQRDLDPAKRVLRGVYGSLEKANQLVLYDVPEGSKPGLHPQAADGFVRRA